MGFSFVDKYTDKTDFNFDVGRERLHLQDGTDTGLDALRRQDTGAFLSAVSPKYQVITHKDANNFAEKLFQQAGLDYEEGHVAVDAKGTRFLREFRFPSREFSPAGSTSALDSPSARGNDNHFPTVLLRNSYDKSSTLDFEFGAFRLICSNGMVIGERVHRVKYRHNAIPDYDKIAKDLLIGLEKSIEGFIDKTNLLNTQPATVYFNELLKRQIVSMKMMEIMATMAPEHIHYEVDEDGNLKGADVSKSLSAYALMQIMTEIGTHRMRKYTRAVKFQQQLAKVFNVDRG